MELNTIAKPYANAIFEIAQQSQSHSDWKSVLEAGVQLANDHTMQAFIASPSTTKGNKAGAIMALFESILGQSLSAQESAFVGLLLDNGRINALPSMLELFDAMADSRSDAKTFDVVSAYALNDQQQQQLMGDLSRKYNAIVSINTFVDENLVGGVVVKEGDKVIDLSVKARTNKLGTLLSVN